MYRSPRLTRSLMPSVGSRPSGYTPHCSLNHLVVPSPPSPTLSNLAVWPKWSSLTPHMYTPYKLRMMATTLEQGGATHQHISHLGKHVARIKAQQPPRGGEKITHVLKGNGDKGNHSGNANLQHHFNKSRVRYTTSVVRIAVSKTPLRAPYQEKTWFVELSFPWAKTKTIP
jgi:hypothetical protein